jgi:HK97 gp10 family phage protein
MSKQQTVSVRITGLAEVLSKMHELPPQLARKGLRKALSAGAKPIRESMKQKVQRGWHVWQSQTKGRSRDFAFIAQHIGVKMEIHPNEQAGIAHIGPVKKGFWALFLEFGTQKMRAFPFMRPAFDEQKQNALNAFVESLKQTFNEVFGK